MDQQVKFCKKCLNFKPISEYYTHSTSPDGLRYRCKACVKAQGRKWRLDNWDRYIAKNKEWVANNLERFRKWRNGKVAEHQDKHPEQRRAQGAVAYAIKDGRLRAAPCMICGEKAEAHHPSYEKENWLKIQWLCKKHHRRANRLGHFPKVYSKEIDEQIENALKDEHGQG